MFAFAKLAVSVDRVKPVMPRQRETDFAEPDVSSFRLRVGINTSPETSTIPTARCGPACRVVWEGLGQLCWSPLSRLQQCSSRLSIHCRRTTTDLGMTAWQWKRIVHMPHRHTIARRAHALLLAALVLLISRCARLFPSELQPEYTAAPSQRRIWSALDADHHDDWFVLLNDGPTALDWRLRAIDTATERIDLQTFLWTFDTTGALLLDHLLLAADRGSRSS